MNRRVKHLPRLWCALQGLLPLEACLAAQRGELAWPAEETTPAVRPNEAARPAVVRTKAAMRRAAQGAS